MKTFQVPVAQLSTSIDDALADMYECKMPGILLRTPNAMRLIHFGTLAHVTANPNLGFPLTLDMVPAEEVIDPHSLDPLFVETHLRKLGKRFALFGPIGPPDPIALIGKATVLSVSEQYAAAYDTPSSFGARCTRPNKPNTTAPRDWYHYYPPKSRDPASPGVCRLDGSQIS